VNVLHGRKSIGWAKSVLPLFTGASSEIFRKVPDRVQIDTTLNRQNPVQNHAVTGRRSGLNRTAVNPALFDGQVRGGFAMAVGAALYERLVYAEDGGFVTGSLLDYALPTASMVPELEILHQETPSPVTPLGAKGVAEGNSMSTPACIANAVADALGVAEVNLPLTPERVLEMVVRRRGQ
jgi:hypothetical protein